MSIESTEEDREIATNSPVTVTIRRLVRAGKNAKFEQLLRDFIPISLATPGHLGVHIVRPAAQGPNEYHVVLKFASRSNWETFHDSPTYLRFREKLQPLLEQIPHIEELSGLESWFTAPQGQSIRPLPRWKMAIVTALAVYPVSVIANLLIRPHIADWHHLLQSLLLSALTVVALTWFLMPLLTRLFRRWLYPKPKVAEPRPIVIEDTMAKN